MKHLRSWTCVAAVLFACSEPQESTEGSGTSGSTSGTTMDDPTLTTTMDPTSATSSGSADSSSTMPADDSGTSTTGPDVELQHGFVRVQLRAAEGREDPFAGTERMQITLNYEQCIFDFYAANPEWAPGGSEGESVFGSAELGGEGWFDRLCDVDVPDMADCQVAAIEQQLEPIPVLRIDYIVNGDLEGRVLPFGPLPTLALAGCAGEVLPTVRLSNGNLVVGYDGTTAEIWDGADYAPNIVATDQEDAIVVDVERTN